MPDLSFHRAYDQPELYYDSAALVVEVLPPRDETHPKFAFYAARGVEKLWVVDPVERSVRFWHLVGGAFELAWSSAPLGLSTGNVEGDLAWPEG